MPAMIPTTPHHHPFGIVTLDAEYVRPGLAAVHLIIEQGHAAIIDTGTNAAVPHVLATLADLGIAPDAVDYVIVTHVHLDHAGAAGAFIAACPNARLVVHPRGARHMIDPVKLVHGSMAVYGEAVFRELYGEIVPVPAARVIEADDGFVLDFNGRRLEFIDTPGHARHHYCIHDMVSNCLFTGDTFGISYRELDVDGRPLIFPSSTPIQFDPDEMRSSIERMLSFNPDAVYLTHFSRLAPPAELGREVLRLLDRYVEIALAASAEEDKNAAIRHGLTALLLDEAHRHGCRLSDAEILEIWHLDLELNAQGLAYWLEAQEAD